MPRDADATRRAVLDAAVGEFAAHGLAGGRIDRIAVASGANPKSIYAYFGSKTALFDAAVTAVLSGVGERVPFTPADLPDYAARLFDDITQHPEAVRLNRWRQLERPEAGPNDTAVYRDGLAVLTSTWQGSAAALGPADALVLALSLPSAWLDIPQDVLRAAAPDPQDADRIADHRAALVEAVRRLVSP